MMNSPNLGFLPNADPTNARAVEALYSLLSDVEQRLQLVKASLTQTLPGIGIGVGNVGQGFSQSHAGYHAFVPTPLGMVPVFIPTSTPGVGWPSGIPGTSPQLGLGATPFGNFRP